jgi:hypothetical protein
MKLFLLAATVTAGLLCSANPADAQFFGRGGVTYIVPLDTSPTYRPSYYASPMYSYYYVFPTYTYDTPPTSTYRYFTYPPSTYVSPGYSSGGTSEGTPTYSPGGVYSRPNGWTTYTYPSSNASPNSYTYPSYSTAPSGAYRLGGGVWHR